MLLDHKQQRFTAPVGPFQQEGNIQFQKAVAEAVLELFLADGGNNHRIIQMGGFFRCKQFKRLARVVEYQVLEILVMAVRHRVVILDRRRDVLAAMIMPSRKETVCQPQRVILVGRLPIRPGLHRHMGQPTAERSCQPRARGEVCWAGAPVRFAVLSPAYVCVVSCESGGRRR